LPAAWLLGRFARGAIGAALVAWYQYLKKPRKALKADSMHGAYLGPEFSDKEIEAFLKKKKIPYKKLTKDKLLATVVDLIAQESVIGWFQGRMEFGPRALGARSIIGDARSEKMQEVMNVKIKFRESFRPFAPVILREKVSEYFDMDTDSPYMMFVAGVAKNKRKKVDSREKKLFGIDKLKVVRSEIPAVTHVDYSARIQTVDKNNPVFYDLLKTFDKKYHCPVLINTSFNVRGEPIVRTPQEAYLCFMRTNIDYLVLGNYLLDKKDQKKISETTNWKKQFSLD
jgi:carbamoyltransferase